MKKYDFLFIHPSTHIKNISPKINNIVTYTIIPVGTVALADLLIREGYETMIIHTGIEQIYNRHFNLEDLIKKYDPLIVGIDLHWYVHSYDAIHISSLVKRLSNAFVVFGGFTASYFAEEILSNFMSVDAVICGDAELPLLKLLKCKDGEDFREVPNLVYRSGESLKRSKYRYVANSSDLNRLNFSNLHLLSNFDEYRRNISQFGDLDPFKDKAKLKTQGWLCLGRGCSVNCSYCGGGKDAFQLLTGRREPVFRAKERVLEELARFEEMKISCVYMDFDPFPEKRDYYHDLFDMIRREKIDISSQFLLWSLSDRNFLRDFNRTFNPLYSTLTLSPESGSEYIRKLNKGFYYSNSELLRWLENIKREMIPIQLYFTSGLSWETVSHFEETIKLAKRIVEEYPVVSISCNPIELEPASPRFLSPKKYGISLKTRKFIDFYNVFKGLAEGLPIHSQLGYETNYLSEPLIIELSQQFREIMSSVQYNKWEKFFFKSNL
ncbi:MAG: radical SAM protein [Candidatus Bathyarchaeia archaeon]